MNADGGDVSEAIGAVGWPSERQRAGQRWGPGAQPPRDDVLVIGYGNALRGDDAVGLRAAERLAADGRLPGARIDACHQLTPELAADIAAARLVVLVDARENGGTAGDVRLEQVVGCCRPLGSHTVDASALVDLTTPALRACPASHPRQRGRRTIRSRRRLVARRRRDPSARGRHGRRPCRQAPACDGVGLPTSGPIVPIPRRSPGGHSKHMTPRRWTATSPILRSAETWLA